MMMNKSHSILSCLKKQEVEDDLPIVAMAGQESSNFMGRLTGDRAIVPGSDRGGGGGGGGHRHLDIDLNENARDKTSLTDDFSGLDPFTRMILGHETSGGPSTLSNHIDLNDGIVPEIGLTAWTDQSSGSVVGADSRQRQAVPEFDYLSSFRSLAAVVGGHDERSGPSSGSGVDDHVNHLHHPLKREGPEDATGVGIRIGASSDQRNVRQRFSYENQHIPTSASNPSHVQAPAAPAAASGEGPLIVLHLQTPSAYPSAPPNLQDASSSRAAALPQYPPPPPPPPDDVDDGDATPIRMLFPPGEGRGEMGHNQTFMHPNNYRLFHGSESSDHGSTPAFHGIFEHVHETHAPPALGHLLQMNAGYFGPQYGGETSSNYSQLGRANGGFLGTTPPFFGLNRRGETLIGAALVHRSSNVYPPSLNGATLVHRISNMHSQVARLFTLSLLTNSAATHQGGPEPTAPIGQGGSIFLSRVRTPNNSVPVSEPLPNLAPADSWLPAYLPAIRSIPSLDTGNWLPAYLAPAHQVDNNFTPVTWDNFEEEEEEEEEEEPEEEGMQYDVEGMSYEELIALEDHIGDVNTGLSEETIMAKLKPKKYSCFKVGPPGDEDICCICQEGYEEGQTFTRLNCRHEFHFDCIKQWLMVKNSCPMCKMMTIMEF